jgi:signal peptidase II
LVELFAAALVTLAFDLVSKQLVESRLPRRSIAVAPGLALRLVRNRRALYRRRATHSLLAIVWLAALAASVSLYLSGSQFQSPLALAGLGIALGGAAGNLIDIVTRHAITDFIDFRWWPAFNLADVAILVGLTLALWPAR